MEIVVFILIVTGCILCHKLSTAFNQKIEEKYCQGCINWWWSVAIAVLLAATLLTIGEDLFTLFLFLTVAASSLSAWLCHRKMTGWGATTSEAGWGCVAQVASAIGIAAAIIFVLFLLFMLFGESEKKRRRR